METTRFAGFAFLIALFVSLAVVSASSLSITNDLPTSVNAGATYTDLKVAFNNSYNESVDVLLSGSSDFTFSPVSATVAGNDSQVFTLSLQVPDGQTNTYTRTLTATVKNGTTTLETLQVTFGANVNEQTFCEIEGRVEGGDLEISDFDITNNGRGSDDEWDLLDEIEIDVTIENTNRDDDVKDVVLELRIYKDGDDVTDDFDLDDETEDLGRIRDDDEESFVFVISEVPVDMDEGDYDIYVRAYSEDDDTQCVSKGNDLDNFGSSDTFAQIEIKKENDEGIIVRDTDFTTLTVQCGQENAQLSLDLYNIGNDKEDEVLVTLENAELKIDEKILLSNFKDGKKREVDFFFNVPEGLQKTNYILDITTYFDWDDDEDEYDPASYDQNSEDDLDEDYTVRIEVLGCSDTTTGSGSNSGSGNTAEPVISAQLGTDSPVVGEDVVVLATLSNPTSEAMNFVVTVNGYQDWATLGGVEPSVVALDAGETKDVSITLVPTESGTHTFELRLRNSNIDVRQDVALNVGSSSGSLVTGNSIFSGWFSSENGSLGSIVSILIILIIVLLIVIFIVAISRSR